MSETKSTSIVGPLILGGLLFAGISFTFYIGWNFGASVALGLPEISYKNAMACSLLLLTLLLVAKTVFRLTDPDTESRQINIIPFPKMAQMANAVEAALTLEDVAQIVNQDASEEELKRIRAAFAKTLVTRVEERKVAP